MQSGHKGTRGHSLSPLRGLWKGTCKAVVIKPSGPGGFLDDVVSQTPEQVPWDLRVRQERRASAYLQLHHLPHRRKSCPWHESWSVWLQRMRRALGQQQPAQS